MGGVRAHGGGALAVTVVVIVTIIVTAIVTGIVIVAPAAAESGG